MSMLYVWTTFLYFIPQQ